MVTKSENAHGGSRVGAGRPQKSGLSKDDYARLFADLGYHLATNKLDDTVECNGKPMCDADVNLLLVDTHDYCDDNNFLKEAEHVRRCIDYAGNKNAFNPIEGYTGNLPEWNGADHIEKVASYLTDSHGVFARWFETWLVGCIAKVYDENYQNPVLLMLGNQGLGKSTFAQWLCPPSIKRRFFRGKVNPANKDHVLKLANTFIWEIDELPETTYKQSADAIKSFLTLSRAVLRKAYGRMETNKPTICNFIATTNKAKSLVDDTGNRRFLVSHITAIDWNYKQVDLDQLWAQAKHMYLTNDDWQLTASEKAWQAENNLAYTLDDDLLAWFEENLQITGNPAHCINFRAVWDVMKNHVPHSQYREASRKLSQWQKNNAHCVDKKRHGTAGWRYIGVQLNMASLETS